MNPANEMELHIRSLKVSYAVEYRFNSKRKWRFDFALPLDKIAVEVHGGIFEARRGRGRHVRGKGFENDREKMNEAQLMGWTVLEVTTAQVRSGQALKWLERALGR